MANRNDQLEAALDNAIAYLQAWPPHPATTAKIRELLEAKRLADKEPKERSMVGVQYAESGVPRIRAELVGGNLHLWSGLGNKEVWELHRRLCSTEGLRLSMRELALNEPRTSLEIALRQRADGFDADPPEKPSSQALNTEIENSRQQLKARSLEFSQAFKECIRMCLVLATLEGEAAEAAKLLGDIQDAVEDVSHHLSQAHYDDTVKDTLAWLNGELNEMMGAPSRRWHLEHWAEK